MQKTFSKEKFARILFLFLLLLLSVSRVSSQIFLADEPVMYKPAAFFIAGVIDERTDKRTVGLLLLKGQGDKLGLQATNLKGGAAAAIDRFLQRNLPKNQALRPIVIAIRELQITENLKDSSSAAAVDGRIRVSLSFGLRKDYGTEHLVDYSGSMQYTRNASGSASLEAYLRSIMKGSLQYLDNWMKINSAQNRSLAKKVNLTFSDFSEDLEGDTIYYAANRPLSWNDFQSRVRPLGPFAAQVIPGIGYTQEASMDKGVINVKVTMKTYLPKSASRARYDSRDAYTLNHEQRHFDIAKIITERFKNKILALPLTPDTFEAALNMQYLDSYRDLDVMQRDYDTETKHGTDRAAQASWNNKIDRELQLTTLSYKE